MYREESLGSKDVEKTFIALSKQKFQVATQPSLLAPTVRGNMHTATVYSGLVSVICSVDSEKLWVKGSG
jgi:hydroxymethylglutaryl-CoA synthase